VISASAAVTASGLGGVKRVVKTPFCRLGTRGFSGVLGGRRWRGFDRYGEVPGVRNPDY